MPKPTIDPDIVAILPPLTEDERNRLRISLQTDGCRDSIVVWKEKNVVIDGHNRMTVCDELNIKYQIVYLKFPSKELAVQWVIDNQLARRNLTDELRRYYRGKDYEAAKKPVGNPQLAQNGPIGNSTGNTAETVAEKHNVSKNTIKRDAEFAEAVDKLPDEQKAEVLAGKTDATPAQVVAAAQAESPSIFCRPCRVNSPKKGCKDCAALRKPKSPAREPGEEVKQPRQPKQGHVVYDWRKYDSMFGPVARAPDAIAKAHKQINCAEHQQAIKLLGDFAELMKAWKKRLTKS